MIRVLLLTVMIIVASPWVQALLIGCAAYYMAMRLFYRETTV